MNLSYSVLMFRLESRKENERRSSAKTPGRDSERKGEGGEGFRFEGMLFEIQKADERSVSEVLVTLKGQS